MGRRRRRMAGRLLPRTRLARDPSVAWRRIDDEAVLVPLCRRADGPGVIYTLNEVAARTWELIDAHRSVAGVRDALAKEFDVEPGRAQADLVELLAEMEALGLVRRVSR